MGAYDYLSWRYEPVAIRRERERQQFSTLRQAITPLVQSGNSLDMLRAQQTVRAAQRLNAPEKKPYNARILEKVRERVQDVAAAASQPKTDFTRPGFSGKISGEDDGGGGFLGGIKKGLGAVGDVFDEGADVAIEGVKKAGAGLEWLNERTAEPAFAIASGQISARRKPILDAQGKPTGRFYREKPSFLDMAQGIGSFVKDPKGAYEEGREAFDERLANPSQNLVSRLALSGAADVTNIAGAGLLTQGLRAGAKARAGTRLGTLLSGAAKTNVAIDVAPAKVLGAPFKGASRLARLARGATGAADEVTDAFGIAGLRPAIAGGSVGGYAYRLRDFDDVVKEVSTSDNPIKRLLVGKTRINPSVLDTEFGKNLTAYTRQRIAGGELAETAVTAALDKHNPAGGLRRAVGAGGEVFDIADDGGIRNLGASSGAIWQDVFSRPNQYQLTPAQRGYVDDFNSVIDDMQMLRAEAGLTPFPRNPDGSLYVPRQTQSVRGVELRRPSSPKLQRVYELAEEGVANGVRYDTDPRNTLALYTRSTYEEIAQKQLADVLEPLSVTASELVPAPVRTRLQEAIANRKAVERSLRSEIDQARKNLARPADTPRKVELRKADLAKLEQLTKYDAPARLDAARAQYDKAKRAYSKAMEAARRSEIAPGKLFGKQEGTIAVGQWRNRFFPREDYERLVDVVGGFGGVAKPKANVVAKAFEGVGNVTRYTASVGDFAAPFVQGLPALARNPIAWGKATAKHYQAFFDPTVQSRFVNDHLETFQWMSQHGIPIGDPEFFTAGGPTGEIAAIGRAVEKIPGGSLVTKPIAAAGKQTAGRFGAAYGTFLGTVRANLVEGLRKGWKGTDAELAQYIRNMTGGLDSRALGVGPSQRGIESTWLAFSPRLLRSTVALVGDAAQGVAKTAIPGMAANAAQREAARTLLQLAAGATGAYVATGLALGKDWEEIEEGLNPLNGKRFLSYQVNGDWIGVGGQVRALTQFAANLAVDPLKLGEMSGDNPLVAFYMTRGAPALNTAGGIAEIAGADVLRYEDIESFPDLVKHIGTGALPFALQGVMEGQNVETTLLGLTGARTSPETPTDKLNAIAQKILDPKTGQPNATDFYDSEPRIRDLIKQKYPHIWQDAVAKGSEQRQRAEQMRSELNAQQAAEDEQFLAGQVSREDWLKSYRDRQDELFFRQKEIYGDSDFARGDTPLDRYYAERERLTDPATNRLTDEGWRQLDKWLAQQSPEDRDYIESNRGLGGTPLVRAYREVQKLQDSYYSLPKYRGYTADESVQIDELWQVARNNSRSTEPAAMLAALRKATRGEAINPRVMAGTRRRILGMLTQANLRAKFKKAHPSLDFFYGQGPLTAEEIAALNARVASQNP